MSKELIIRTEDSFKQLMQHECCDFEYCGNLRSLLFEWHCGTCGLQAVIPLNVVKARGLGKQAGEILEGCGGAIRLTMILNGILIVRDEVELS